MLKSDNRNLNALVILVILLVGFSLRAYHIHYPPIGYHSMKEIHYLSVARGYIDHGDFLHKRVLYSGLSEGEGYMESFPQFQFLPLIYFGLWKIFGVKVWLARLVIILFSLAAVIMTGKVCSRLTERKEVSLVSTFLMAIVPLSVFFGRNIQPDIPAMFFLMLLYWYFLKWIEEFRLRYLVGVSLSLFMTAIIKLTFLFPVLAIVFVFPWEKLVERETRKTLLTQSMLIAAGIMLIALWLVFTRIIITGTGGLFPASRLFLAKTFTVSYWKTVLPVIWRHIGKNYTFIYFSFVLVGLLASVLSAGSKLSRMIIGSAVSAILYFFLIPDFAMRHSYYHIPFLPVICIGIASGLHEATSILEGRSSRLRYVALVVLLLCAMPWIRINFYRHFDILTLGSDTAGRYIRDNGSGNDRIFISYASPSDRRFAGYRTQLYGTLWEAGKRGNLLPANLELIKKGEVLGNFRWIVLYRSGDDWFPCDKKILDHIHSNYSVRQIGYREDKLIYYLLERGGSFDSSQLLAKELLSAGKYRFSFGEVEVFVRQ